jgi:CDP-glycerol glycerophosphotransferase (TagB/SpsB family)
MADKQTDADKAAAMKEYLSQHNAAVDRIAALREARLARDAQEAQAKAQAKAEGKPLKAAGKTGVKKAPVIKVLKAKSRS